MPISIDDLGLPLRGAKAGWDVPLRGAITALVTMYNGLESMINSALAVISGAVDTNDAVIASTVTSGPATVAALNSTYATKAVETTVDSGRLSEPELDARFGLVFTPERFGAVGDGVADDTVALNDAYFAAASTAFSDGGTLLLTQTYRLTAPLVLDEAASVLVEATGATLLPDAGIRAVRFNAGSANTGRITVLSGATIDGNGTGLGVEVVNHFSPVLRDVIIRDCAHGLLITGQSGGWCESSRLDRVVVDNCLVGIEFAVGTGTGSFGYLAWGFVGIYNVPTNGVGFRVGAGSFLYHAHINMLVVQIQGDNATAWDIDGVMGRNSMVHAMIESSASSYTVRKGIDLAGTAVLEGLALRMYFQGTFSSKVVNPSAIPFQMRDAGDNKLRGNVASNVLQGYGVFGDTHDRVQVRGDRIGFGSGSADPDAFIVRYGAGIVGFDLTNRVRIAGTWEYPLQMGPSGNTRMWVSAAGVLYVKQGTPTSETDGTVVGTQT